MGPVGLEAILAALSQGGSPDGSLANPNPLLSGIPAQAEAAAASSPTSRQQISPMLEQALGLPSAESSFLPFKSLR